MKYTELNINKKLFGDDYLLYDWKETDKEIHIYLKSQSHTGICPQCGEKSNSLHATFKRTIQTLPIRMKKTYMHIIAYKFNCLNNSCELKVFRRILPFAPPSQVRTTELTSFILAVSVFMSNEGASKVLDSIGVKVSNDTIKRIYDQVSIEDEPNVKAVGIDDVAIRKGQTYATAIYDLKDHHMIALLDGRDANTLKEWLKHHKKIELVARDRASAYAKAINEILPDCIQVADRFHLLQNLIERMRAIFKEELPSDIFIKDGTILNETPEKIRVLKVAPNSKQLEQYHYGNDVPIDKNGQPIDYDNKNHNLNSKQYKKHAESRKKNNI